MECIEDVNIPTRITEPCGNAYLSTSCITIPVPNTVLSLGTDATQTEVNNAITASLVHKEQQIQKMTNDIDLIDGSKVDISVEGGLAIRGLGTEVEPFIIGTSFDIDNYQLKNIQDDLGVASALNEGRFRYRKNANNSYVDISMQTGVGIYAWKNLITNKWI